MPSLHLRALPGYGRGYIRVSLSNPVRSTKIGPI